MYRYNCDICQETIILGENMTAALPVTDLTTTWVGIASLAVFVISYYFIATEDKYMINKAKPALFGGTFIFILIGIYYSMNGLNLEALHNEVNHLILEIAGIFFLIGLGVYIYSFFVDNDSAKASA